MEEEPIDNSCNFLCLATSSDDGILEINEDVCKKLFDVQIDLCTPGLCVVGLILDPINGNEYPLLMRQMLSHLLLVDDGQEKLIEFYERFENGLDNFKSNNSNDPMLVAWSNPIWVEKGASTRIPVYILDIIGNFRDGFKDPNFIALAGLSLLMSSSTVVMMEEELKVDDMRDLVPFLVQGLRSEQLNRYQQINFLIRNAKSGPYGDKDSTQLLQDFWTSSIDDDVISRVREVFEAFNCHKIPPSTPGNKIIRQTLFKRFFSSIFDNYITIKRSQNGAPMNGEDVVKYMEKHRDNVTDSDYEAFLEVFTKIGQIVRKEEDKQDPWREPIHANDNVEDDSETDSDQSECTDGGCCELPKAEEICNDKEDVEVDDVTTIFTKFNIIADVKEVEKPSQTTRSKFRNLLKMEDEQPVVTENFNQGREEFIQVNDETIKSATKTVNHAAGNLSTPPIESKPLVKSKVPIDQFPDEQPSINSESCLLTTKGDKIIVEDKITPNLDMNSGSSEDLVEIPKNEDDNYQTVFQKLQQITVQVLCSKSPDSTTSTNSIVNEASQLMSVTFLNSTPATLNKAIDDVTKIIEQFITIVVKFQDFVEEDFRNITRETIVSKSKEGLDSFKFEIFLPCLSNMLSQLSTTYIEIMDNNKTTLTKVIADVISHECSRYNYLICQELAGVRQQDWDSIFQESIKCRTQTLCFEEAENTLKDFLFPEQIKQMTCDLQEKLDSILSREASQLEQRWEQENAMSSSLERYLSDYTAEFEKEANSTLTVGLLEEARQKHISKVAQDFRTEFSESKSYNQFEEKLFSGLATIGDKVISKFKTNLTPRRSSLTFATPSLTPQSSRAGKDALLSSEKDLSVETVSIAMHFGIDKLSMNYWDDKKNVSVSLLNNVDNIFSYVGNTFKIGRHQQHYVNAGHIFVDNSISLQLWPENVKLTGCSIILVMLITLKRYAETNLSKKVSNCVLVIPSFIDCESYSGISRFSTLLNFEISIISEADAVAIQYFGRVGMSHSSEYLLPSLVVIVLRKTSYEMASFSCSGRHISRQGFQCWQKSDWKVRRAFDYMMDYIYDGFISMLKSVTSFLPKAFKVILVSETRDVVNNSFKSRIKKSVVPNGLSDEQLLSVCAVKGASLLAGIEHSSNSAWQYWTNFHGGIVADREVSLLLNEHNYNAIGVMKGWWAPTTSEEESEIITHISLAQKIMNKKYSPIKQKFKKYFNEKMLEIKNDTNFSEYMKELLTGLIEKNLSLVKHLDVSEKYYTNKQKELDKEIEDIKTRNNSGKKH
ncbi:uncharacterized protein LOC110863364 [Folsomia candida]|nr:uncharacterized protein LOC110863364 [Folsomia candida]